MDIRILGKLFHAGAQYIFALFIFALCLQQFGQLHVNVRVIFTLPDTIPISCLRLGERFCLQIKSRLALDHFNPFHALFDSFVEGSSSVLISSKAQHDHSFLHQQICSFRIVGNQFVDNIQCLLVFAGTTQRYGNAQTGFTRIGNQR